LVGVEILGLGVWRGFSAVWCGVGAYEAACDGGVWGL